MLRRLNPFYFIAMFFLLGCNGCTSDPKPKTPKPTTSTPKPKTVDIPKFHRDSAYLFIQQQVDFGPRVPNTKEHTVCKNWFVEKFKSYGAEVIEQNFKVRSFQNKMLNSTNVIAQFNPENSHRIILAAHWDSRHIADQDANKEKQDKAILGADDGASGVGILIEIARQISLNKTDLGVDIVLFDAEDQGLNGGNETDWCLGSQHWARNLHTSPYKPKFGILLDMAGSKNARFTKDETSMTYAPKVMNKVWKIAQGRGYGNFFINQNAGPLIDDHKFVNEIARIPMIDIINRPQTQTGFGTYWHTHNDNMSIIDKKTLRAVGQTVLAVVYQEAAGIF